MSQSPIPVESEIKWLPIKELKPNPKNPNKHPEEQIERLAKIIRYQGWRSPIIVSNQSGYIVAGHGRLEAAKKLGFTTVPVQYQDFENEDQEYAHMTADNAIASWADLDLSGINLEVPNLGPDFDIEFLGLKDFKIDAFENEQTHEYTKKIKLPIYEPRGEKPQINELIDLEKHQQLLKNIEQSNAAKPIKEFLKIAASRHIVFDYSKIAEWYCHQDQEVKALCEENALVIIDYDKALENGFIKLTETLETLIEQ